jgi:hypothetical protein
LKFGVAVAVAPVHVAANKVNQAGLVLMLRKQSLHRHRAASADTATISCWVIQLTVQLTVAASLDVTHTLLVAA